MSAVEADDRTAATRWNDVALGHDGSPVEPLLRFENALRGMNGRRSIRNDIARYESVAFAFVAPEMNLDAFTGLPDHGERDPHRAFLHDLYHFAGEVSSRPK